MTYIFGELTELLEFRLRQFARLFQREKKPDTFEVGAIIKLEGIEAIVTHDDGENAIVEARTGFFKVRTMSGAVAFTPYLEIKSRELRLQNIEHDRLADLSSYCS